MSSLGPKSISSHTESDGSNTAPEKSTKVTASAGENVTTINKAPKRKLETTDFDDDNTSSRKYPSPESDGGEEPVEEMSEYEKRRLWEPLLGPNFSLDPARDLVSVPICFCHKGCTRELVLFANRALFCSGSPHTVVRTQEPAKKTGMGKDTTKSTAATSPGSGTQRTKIKMSAKPARTLSPSAYSRMMDV